MKVNQNLPKLLERLNQSPEPVSGEELSAEFGITRVALWKQVQALKALGCDIQSNRKGYWVARGDEALPWLVSGGQPVHYFAQTSSTMDEALTLAQAGAEEGTVVAAARQSQGRGTQGRGWDSPQGGLYFTLILRRKFPQAWAGILVLNALGILVDLLRAQGLSQVWMKWPNDVYLDNHKVGGLLLEAYGSFDAPVFWLLGVGLNVHQVPGQNHLEPSPGRLSRREILTGFREALLASPLEVPQPWEKWSWPRGRALTVQTKAGETFQGSFQGFNDYADLLVSGRAFRFGETFHVIGDNHA